MLHVFDVFPERRASLCALDLLAQLKQRILLIQIALEQIESGDLHQSIDRIEILLHLFLDFWMIEESNFSQSLQTLKDFAYQPYEGEDELDLH